MANQVSIKMLLVKVTKHIIKQLFLFEQYIGGILLPTDFSSIIISIFSNMSVNCSLKNGTELKKMIGNFIRDLKFLVEKKCKV